MKARIKNDVGDFLVEQIVSSAGAAQSPVAGGEWERKLSPEYRKKKKAEGLPPTANMELEGGLLDSLTFKNNERGVELGWFGEEAGKADGHNNFSGKSSLPRRQTLPDVGQEFKPAIQGAVEKIVSDALADTVTFKETDFEAVNNRTELYEVLGEYFEGMGRSEIKAVVSSAPALVDLLDSLKLLRFL